MEEITLENLITNNDKIDVSNLDFESCDEVTTEGFGLSEIFSIYDINNKTLFKRADVIAALKRAKLYAEKHRLTFPTPSEAKTSSKGLLSMIFRRGGGGGGGGSNGVNATLDFIGGAGNTGKAVGRTVGAITSHAGAKVISSGARGIINAAVPTADAIYRLMKSDPEYVQVNGVTIQIVDILTSRLEQNIIPLYGALAPLIRKANGKEMKLYYVIFKKPNGKMFIKHLCKAIINKDGKITKESTDIWGNLRGDK